MLVPKCKYVCFECFNICFFGRMNLWRDVYFVHSHICTYLYVHITVCKCKVFAWMFLSKYLFVYTCKEACNSSYVRRETYAQCNPCIFGHLKGEKHSSSIDFSGFPPVRRKINSESSSWTPESLFLTHGCFRPLWGRKRWYGWWFREKKQKKTPVFETDEFVAFFQ